MATLAGLALLGPVGAHAADINLSLGSCPVGCTAYTWSAGIADVINREVKGVRATAEETKGYVENIKLLQRGEMEAAMATSLSSYQAYSGTGTFSGGKKGEILSWMAITPVAMHVVTLADSPIKTWPTSRASGSAWGSRRHLDARCRFDDGDARAQARYRLQAVPGAPWQHDGHAGRWQPGCGAVERQLPASPLKKLTSQREIRLLPVPQPVFDKHQAAYPPYFRVTIPGKLYEGVTQDTPTFGLANGLVILKSVPENLVYDMTKAVFENLGKLKGVHPAFGRVSKDTVLNGFGAPLHPGALKYYREIGVPGIEEFVARTSR
ncbi:MAG: TAXI family TRAP transporter solute-binding subunit [Burkholderiaceae bacterium]